MPWFVCVAVACLIGGMAGPATPQEYEDIRYDSARFGPEKPLQQIVEEDSVDLAEGQFLPNPRVEIEKGAHALRLYSGDSLLKTYRIQLGKRPRGAKTRRYDGRTPVGSYRICGRNRSSRYYLSLQIDYPNEEDIARALEAKRITGGRLRTFAMSWRPGNVRPAGRRSAARSSSTASSRGSRGRSGAPGESPPCAPTCSPAISTPGNSRSGTTGPSDVSG